jgi:Transposase DDE domain
MSLAAATVAEVYKQRWQIELFFKALKQSLRVKTFVGTSANALKMQIWSALIAMLLVTFFNYVQHLAGRSPTWWLYSDNSCLFIAIYGPELTIPFNRPMPLPKSPHRWTLLSERLANLDSILSITVRLNPPTCFPLKRLRPLFPQTFYPFCFPSSLIWTAVILRVQTNVLDKASLSCSCRLLPQF